MHRKTVLWSNCLWILFFLRKVRFFSIGHSFNPLFSGIISVVFFTSPLFVFFSPPDLQCIAHLNVGLRATAITFRSSCSRSIVYFPLWVVYIIVHVYITVWCFEDISPEIVWLHVHTWHWDCPRPEYPLAMITTVSGWALRRYVHWRNPHHRSIVFDNGQIIGWLNDGFAKSVNYCGKNILDWLEMHIDLICVCLLWIVY